MPAADRAADYHQRRARPAARRCSTRTRALQNPEARDVAGRRSKSDFVLTAPEGGPIRNKNFRVRRFEPAMTKMIELHPDLVRLEPHDLRHIAASLAISAGANVKAVQKMLGHASAAMTIDVYDLFEDDLDAVGDALSAAISLGAVGKMWARVGVESETVISMKKKS